MNITDLQLHNSTNPVINMENTTATPGYVSSPWINAANATENSIVYILMVTMVTELSLVTGCPPALCLTMMSVLAVGVTVLVGRVRMTLWSSVPSLPGELPTREVSAAGPDTGKEGVPRSVNYHFTRQCNYSCGFCFHTAKSSFVLPLDTAKSGLEMLAKAGMEKLNFSGGEPFIHQRGDFVGELVKFCKTELKLPSVSIVSNGSLVREKWFKKYGEYLDILAVSCDSFDPYTNATIGRQQGQKSHLDSLLKVRDWCRKYKVAFKLNTVVNTYNKDEDMIENIRQLDPCRWKVFQCLLLDGENVGEDSLRKAEPFLITDEEFRGFLSRHQEVECLVPESNEKMQNSYLILDEYMRFLDCTGGSKIPSPSILDIGVSQAMDRSGFDEAMFYKRGGRYVWSKADMKLEW